jgi:hypothetical protein
MTLDVYAHLLPAMDDQAVQAITDFPVSCRPDSSGTETLDRRLAHSGLPVIIVLAARCQRSLANRHACVRFQCYAASERMRRPGCP